MKKSTNVLSKIGRKFSFKFLLLWEWIETPKLISSEQVKANLLYKHCPAAVWKAFNIKFMLDDKVQYSVFWNVSN